MNQENDRVPEGGKAPDPTNGGHGHPKAAASRALDEGNPTAGTSHATVGQEEKAQAEQIGAGKAHGRGYHKED